VLGCGSADGILTVRTFILCLIALAGGMTLADAWPQTVPVRYINCLPSDVFPGKGEGTPYVFFATDKVEGRIGWCRTNEVRPDGGQSWRPVPYQWCLKTRCTGGVLNPWAVLDQLRAAPDVFAAASSVAATLRVGVMPGSPDDFDLRTWWARACRVLTTPPYPSTPPQGFAPSWVFPPNYCPAEPAPPAAEIWRTPSAGSGTIFTTSAGRLTGLVGNRKAPPNALADCALARVSVGTKTYCSLAGGVATEVTEVVKVTQ
jgi:hypothetical protein